jgi:hypothetical protein
MKSNIKFISVRQTSCPQKDVYGDESLAKVQRSIERSTFDVPEDPTGSFRLTVHAA